MSKMRFRRSWLRVISAISGSVFIGGCVTDLQFRDFLTSTVVRTFWTSVASYTQAVIIDQAQQDVDAGG